MASAENELANVVTKALARAGIRVADKALNFIPSWSEIGTAVDGVFGGAAPAALEGGGVAAGSGLATGGVGSGITAALGGLGAASAAAAPMLLFATIMSILNKMNHDPSVEYAGGSSENLGPLSVTRVIAPGYEQPLEDMYEAFLGDGSWYEGGDPNKVGTLNSSYGMQRVKAGLPYYALGSMVPYRSPELAIDSGRQMARGRMDLPVEHEPLPSARSQSGDPLYGQYFGNASLPTVDSVQELPSEWDNMIDQARNSAYFAQSNTEASQAFSPSTIEQFVAGLDPRLGEFFDAGLTTDDMYAYTGPNSLVGTSYVDTPENDTDTTTEDDGPTPYTGITFGNGDSDMPNNAKSPLVAALAKHRANNTDSVPALINPNEATILAGLGGSGEYDPQLGMYRFQNTEAGDDVWAAWFNANGTPSEGGYVPTTTAAPAPLPMPAAESSTPERSDGERPAAPYREPAYRDEQGRSVAEIGPITGDIGWGDAEYARRAAEWGDDGSGGGSDDDRNWGVESNRNVNRELADATKYTGNFGGGEWNEWIADQPYETQQQAANILARNNQPERIDPNTWGSGFMNESPYVNGTVDPGFVDYPDNPPDGAGIVPLGTGYNWLGTSTGQQQLIDYLDQRRKGNTPDATKFDPETNQSYALYDGVPEAIDPTYELLALLPPEVFNALATSFGLDPNGRDTWLALENFLGLRTMDYGGPVYEGGSFQGLEYPEGREVLAPIERGYITLGSGPNTIDVPLADLVSGKYNVAAIDAALSGGYDPNGFEGSTDTLTAARQIMELMPEITKVPWLSAEFNILRKPIEQATPGFNQQVGNRIARQMAQGRSIPSGNVVGPTDLASVITGRPSTQQNNAVLANNPGLAAAISGAGGGSNAPGFDRGWESLGNGYETKDGVMKYNGVLVIPQANGLYLDTMYGFLRNPQGIIVNSDGSPVITQYNAGYPAGSSDPWRVFGSSGANAMMGEYAGVDLGSLDDGNGTPIVGRYGGGTPTPISNMRRGQDIVRDIRGDPWSTSTYNTGGVPNGGNIPLPSPGTGGGGGGGGNNGGNNGGGNGTGNSAIDKLLSQFPPGYELQALADALDDPIIQRILSEGRATAGDALARARASGQLNDVGYNAAWGALTGPESAIVQARLEELADELLGGYRQDIRDVLADAYDYASLSPKNFSTDPYKQSIDAIVGGVNNNFYGELLRALGGPAFDIASLLNTGGMGQGAISSGPSSAGVF